MMHDQRMTFLARPSQVKTILTDLKYISLTEHKEDGLFISVFDGIGGDCISEYEQTYSSNRIGTMLIRYSSVQNGCYAERAYVRLVGNPEISSDDESGSNNEPINRAHFSRLDNLHSHWSCCLSPGWNRAANRILWLWKT